MRQAAITLDKVSKKFNNELLFHQVCVTFSQGVSYAVQGVSGTGKSTLLSLVGNLDTPTSGTITYHTQNERSLPLGVSQSLSTNVIGYLFQQQYLIKELSVIENIQLPGLLTSHKKEYCDQRAYMLLEKVKLLHKAHAYPGQLSGGELQRVALARALFNEPLFLIADEPTASLDHKTAHEMVGLLCQLQKEWNMGLVVATHDKAIARMLDERYEFYEQTLIKQQ